MGIRVFYLGTPNSTPGSLTTAFNFNIKIHQIKCPFHYYSSREYHDVNVWAVIIKTHPADRPSNTPCCRYSQWKHKCKINFQNIVILFYNNKHVNSLPIHGNNNKTLNSYQNTPALVCVNIH